MKTIAVLRSNPKDAALVRLVQSLAKRAHVDCLVWDRQGDFEPVTATENLRYVKCGIRAGFYTIGTLFKLVGFQAWLFCKLMTRRWDIIHAIDLDTGIPGRLAAWLKGKAFVYHCLDPYHAILPSRWPQFLADVTHWLENLLISSSNLFIITDLLRLPQHEGADPNQVLEIANIPSVPQLLSSLSQSPLFTVGYLGSLIEGRNLLTVIEACGELEREGVQLIIGSFGPLEDEIAVHAARWPNITFRKWIPSYGKMLEEESTFDLFFHTTDPASASQRWVSPNKLFESMAFGKPIIVSRGTLAAQRVEAFGNGIAVSYGSKKEFQEALLQCKQNPELTRQMGERGLEEFQRNWRPEVMEKRLLDAYEQLMRA